LHEEVQVFRVGIVAHGIQSYQHGLVMHSTVSYRVSRFRAANNDVVVAHFDLVMAGRLLG